MPKVCSTAFSLIFLVLAFGQLRSKFAELSLSACAGLAYKPNFVNLNFQFFSLPGLARLLENNVYKAAYPLHEVSKESLVISLAGGCVAWLHPLIVRRLSKHLLIILLCLWKYVTSWEEQPNARKIDFIWGLRGKVLLQSKCTFQRVTDFFFKITEILRFEVVCNTN